MTEANQNKAPCHFWSCLQKWADALIDWIILSWKPVLVCLLLIGIVVFVLIGKTENIPSFISGIGTLAVAAWGLYYTREKVRLDLFEKRWEIYENTVKFCSHVQTHAAIRQETKMSPEEAKEFREILQGSFRGLGYHKYRHLFGKDVSSIMDSLNDCYSILVAYRNKGYVTEEEDEAVRTVYRIAEKLPDLFAPYLYFGDVMRKK